MPISWKERLLDSERERMTEKQLRIVMAAVELFGEQGYADTSTRQIAQRAGVSEGAIFKHFATKKELLLSITRLIISNIIEPIFDYGLEELFTRSYDALEDFLRPFMQNRLELIESNIVLVRVVLQEALFQPEIRLAFMQALQRSRLPQGLHRLKEQGLLPDKPVADLMGLMTGSLMGYVFSRYLMMPEMFAHHQEQDREDFMRFLARGLRDDMD